MFWNLRGPFSVEARRTCLPVIVTGLVTNNCLLSRASALVDERPQVFGTNGKICQRSDTGEILDTKKYHHLTINTVTPEPSQTAREAFSEVLWIVDISAPADNWGNLTKQVATMTKTFAVGTVEQLNAGRNTSSS
ncbi:unnamed protein product [Durusdinium trenchii]|uniref:Uncharacterized protein n=1 Tax=Durusdinium trenchii TaxID=1381693 RepID=A0ABP0LR02_9DINO